MFLGFSFMWAKKKFLYYVGNTLTNNTIGSTLGLQLSPVSRAKDSATGFLNLDEMKEKP